jgi:hypothetical protein
MPLVHGCRSHASRVFSKYRDRRISIYRRHVHNIPEIWLRTDAPIEKLRKFVRRCI